jgi:hypothetical protein
MENIATMIGLFSAVPVVLILVALHCVYGCKRDSVFPTAELEKFDKE